MAIISMRAQRGSSKIEFLGRSCGNNGEVYQVFYEINAL